MTNPEITNNDSSRLPVWDPSYQQDVVTFGTAETKAMGQLLARKQVADTVTASAITGTGNGTITAAALAPGGPAKVGAYEVKCLEKITNGGRFKLTDPDGLILENQIIVLAGAGGVIAYTGHGLTFTITDGSTDFEVNDLWTLTTTVDGNLDSYDVTAVDGLEIPVALMTRARTEASAANYPEKVLIAGEVALEIVVAASGALSQALRDQLKAIGIIVKPGVVLDMLDNA